MIKELVVDCVSGKLSDFLFLSDIKIDTQHTHMGMTFCNYCTSGLIDVNCMTSTVGWVFFLRQLVSLNQSFINTPMVVGI